MAEIDPGIAAVAASGRRRRSKAPGAFRTISEVATVLEVPQHVLRFWESKFTQVKPLKRGGGRRYYRPEDVDLLRGIRHLLYSDGYTIKGVQKLFREIGSKTIMESGRSLSGTVGTIGAAGVAAARTRRQSGVERVQAQQAPELPLSAPTSSQLSAMSGTEGGAALSSGQRDKLLGLAAELGELRDILRRSGAKT
jgi:DNA-binding transcriptional MerR regulator